MKTILVLLSFLILSQNLWARSNTGGMDGGGGGTLPTHPVMVYEVAEIAQESKQHLLFILNAYEWREKYDQQTSLYKKLFGGPRKAQEVLKDLRLEVRLDKPCFTSGGTEVDASIYGVKSNTICLSAHRISQKVDKAAAEREVIALLMHEVSHFLGANEDEAVELQKEISWWILNAKAPKLNGEALRNELSRFRSLLHLSIEALDQFDLSKAKDQLSKSLVQLYQWERSTKSSPYNFFEPREEQYQFLLRLKLIWAENYLQTLIPGPDQDRANNRYNKIFGSRDYFYAYEDIHWSKEHLYYDEKVERLRSLEGLKNFLNDLKNEYELRSVYTQQVTFGMRWMRLNGHLTRPSRNPWQDYVGRYVVESVECDNPGRSESEVEFRVESTDAGLFFRSIFSSASMSDLIEFGAYHMNVFLNSYGETSEGGVFMIREMGGSWSLREYANAVTSNVNLKRISADRFEMTKTISNLSKDVTKSDFFQTCVYKGVIQ